MFATDKNDDGHLNHGLQARVEKTVMTASVKCIIAGQCGGILLWPWWPAADASACVEFVTGVSEWVGQQAAGEAGLH